MNKFITTLNDLIPVFIIVSMALTMTLERFLPYFIQSNYRGRQRWHNIGNIAIAFVLNASLGTFVISIIVYAESKNMGLLHLFPSSIFSTIIGMLLIDLNSYWFHRLYHRVPLFWRFHRVHHSDTEMDATSALRLHPFEFIFQSLSQMTILPLLGVSPTSFVIYFAIALPFFVINHSNLHFPNWYEKYMAWIFVTPNWHRVHHAHKQPATDSNYGDMFSIWDRIFGTHHQMNEKDIIFGLEEYRSPEEQSVKAQMLNPFVSQNPNKTANTYII